MTARSGLFPTGKVNKYRSINDDDGIRAGVASCCAGETRHA